LRPLALDEMVGLDAYERLRDAYRERVVAMKRTRRLAVGDRVTLLFENRETVRFQVQEMLRIERIRTPERVQHELDVYNALVPRAGELSATLLIEIPERDRIRAELDRLLGIDACVFLVLGEGPDARRLPAEFDRAQLQEDRISAVHYLRIPLPGDAPARLADVRVAAAIEIDHPAYRAAAALPPPLRASLAADLAGEPAPLLVPAPGEGVVRAAATALAAGPTRGDRTTSPAAAGHGPDRSAAPGRSDAPPVRVRPAERPRGPGHVVVEPARDDASWLDADPALEAAVLAEVKRQAAAVAAAHGACRVVCDPRARPWRFEVFAPEE
jgi:hypothetical protein